MVGDERAAWFGRTRRGITLVEILVVIGVTGLLIGLLLPAVQAAREAARRVHCASNLRQIGVALQAYHADHNCFPPSNLPSTQHGLWTANSISGLAQILPHLEQTTLYQSINLDLVHHDSAASPWVENKTARHTLVSVFVCPSDGQPEGFNSYRFNRGRWRPQGRAGPSFDGPFCLGVMPNHPAIRDGLSNTVFLSERLRGSFTPGREHPLRDVKIPPMEGTSFASDHTFIPYCHGATASSWEFTSGRYWLYSGLTNSHYNHNGPPNDLRPACGMIALRDLGSGFYPPSSAHPRLVNVLFGDAHVGAVTNSVDERLWISMGTHASSD